MAASRNYPPGPKIVAAILAGGLSSRMGRPKAQLRLGGASMIQRIRKAAQVAGFPVHVIRRDIVPRCGPIGGILTALTRYPARAILFLPCDTPFLRPQLLREIASEFARGTVPVFAIMGSHYGFPCIIPTCAKAQVAAEIAGGRHSLQSLARRLDAKGFQIPKNRHWEVFNVNMPKDLEKAVEIEAFWRKSSLLKPRSQLT